MLSPQIITNSDHIISPTVPSLPVVDTSFLQIQGELCVVGGARHAQCVLGIIRISWNYTVSSRDVVEGKSSKPPLTLHILYSLLNVKQRV